MKLIRVIWKDAKCLNSSLTIDEIKKQTLIETISIGYLVDETKEKIVIAATIFKEINRDDLDSLFKEGFLTFKDISFIPKSQIIKIEELMKK